MEKPLSETKLPIAMDLSVNLKVLVVWGKKRSF